MAYSFDLSILSIAYDRWANLESIFARGVKKQKKIAWHHLPSLANAITKSNGKFCSRNNRQFHRLTVPQIHDLKSVTFASVIHQIAIPGHSNHQQVAFSHPDQPIQSIHKIISTPFDTINICKMNFFLRSLLLLSAMLLSVHAFQRPVFSRHTSVVLQTATALKAWSLTPPSRFGTFEHTWYNEVQYPTAGRPVYEE